MNQRSPRAGTEALTERAIDHIYECQIDRRLWRSPEPVAIALIIGGWVCLLKQLVAYLCAALVGKCAHTSSSFWSRLELPRTLHLAQGDALLLSRTLKSSSWLRLDVESGIGRLATSFGEAWPDVTLAFCGGDEPEWLHYPTADFCQLEALTPMQLRLHQIDQGTHQIAAQPSLPGPADRDLISEWLLDLHLVRHPVGTDARLATLLRLLIARFGSRTADGYRLPFTLSHARLAELICATRSTVTRQLVILRQSGKIREEEVDGSLLLMPSFVEEGPELRAR